MTNLCPKPCSRLATAAIFIIIGVVQLLSGAILLRSKYADLLSGPNFMSGSSNMVIGCIYGTISSIWKINKKKKSGKATAMKNVLASLLLSVIAVNATAIMILILSDGNSLLNLHFQKDTQNTIDFASEILAYAYITSVCSPIICIVIALVILSGRFIEICRDIKNEKAKNSIANNDSYNWVFDPKTAEGIKVISDTIETSSESASEDSVFNSDYSQRKSIPSIKNIPSPLNMWKDKRERLLKDANWSREQSGWNSVLEKPNFYEGSHAELIPRIKKSSLRRDFNLKLGDLEKQSSKTFKSILKRSSSSPVSRETGFHVNSGDKDSVDSRRRYALNQGNSDEREESCIPKYSKIRKGASDRNKKNKFIRINVKSLNRIQATDNKEIHFADPVISELKAETLRELKRKVAKILPGGSIAVIKLPDNCEEQEYVSSESSDERTGDTKNSYHQKPHTSGVSRYKLFTNCSENSNSSGKQLLSDITPESVHQTNYWAENSLYTERAYKSKGRKSGFSAISKIRSKSFDSLNEEIPLQNQGKEEFSLKMVDLKKTDPLDMQKVSSSKQQNRKFDTSRKMSMASIAEIPSDEDCYSERNSVYSASDFDENSQMTDENSNRVKMSPTAGYKISMKAPRRKTSLRSNKLLKRMWSSSEPKINVSSMIVDEDSLIGLSEEELLARTSRLRSLRKTVEHRLKTKKESEKQVATNSYSSAL